MKLHYLTKGFNNWYGQTFLYPLIRYRKKLRDYDIHLKFFNKESESLTNCDLLIIDNTWFREKWAGHTDQVIQKLIGFRNRVDRLHYFDYMDSSGMPHARALPYVDRYWKSYLLKDRSQYLKPWYGHRVYTEYYYQNFNISDSMAVRSEPVEDALLLKKFGVSWSSALANYSYRGLYQMELYKRLSMPFILKMPPKFTHPLDSRTNKLFCRLGSNYPRETLAYQRKKLCEMLSSRIPTNRVSRKQYFNELADSKLAISPFGNGEVCYRDYEAFLSGTLLIKPDMSHMETWPNLYKNNETILQHRWDLTDLESLIETVSCKNKQLEEIAMTGQNNYRQYLLGKSAAEQFCQHFNAMVTEKDIKGVPGEVA